jgi:hypothetical protein
VGAWAKSVFADEAIIVAHIRTAIAVTVRLLPGPEATSELRSARALRLRSGQARADADLSSSKGCRLRASFVDGSIGTPYLKNTVLKLEP